MSRINSRVNSPVLIRSGLPRLRRSLTISSDGMALCLLILLSSFLFVSSESAWYGDATVYVSDVRAGAIIEPGHLLWRPLGYLMGALPRQQPAYSIELWYLQLLCLAGSVLAVISMYLVASRMFGRSAAFLAATLMAVSNGFWAYSFSGCSYSMSVLFTTLALRFALSDRGTVVSPWGAFAAGIFGGLSAATWAIQLLVAPAIWLALMLTPTRDQASTALRIANTARLAAGYLLAFVIPVLAAYWVQNGYGTGSAGATGNSVAFGAWLSSSSHGIPAHYDVARVLRAAMGWPQSVISTSDLGPQLRLWRIHEASFPASAWLASFVVFYAALTSGIRVLAARYSRLDDRDRGVVVASAAAIVINLLFAARWQGTDLERYFPSWPFQLLLIALIIRLTTENRPSRRIVIAGVAVLMGIALVNWYGTFEPVLGQSSYRNAWLRELRQATSARDLVIVFGPRIRVVESPHEPNMPRMENIATDIVMRGSEWRSVALQNIAATRRRGGRVFLADSLFGTSSTPRDGWSFKEYPAPTPGDLQNAFLAFKSDRVAFVVAGERVWLGKD